MPKHQTEHNKPTPLTRRLGLWGVLFLTLSVTTPASSVFVILPGMLRIAGTGAIWSMLIAAVVCVATAFIYAELSSSWPVAGGEYVAVAQTLGSAAGFVMLGVNVFNNLLFVPVVALGVSSVLAVVLPGLPVIPVAVAVVVGSALVEVLDIRVNAWVTGVFLMIEVLALLAVTALGFAEPVRDLGGLMLRPVVAGAAGLEPATMAGIGLATTIGIFALNGYGSAIYFGEEMHEAPSRMPATSCSRSSSRCCWRASRSSPRCSARPISSPSCPATTRSASWSPSAAEARSRVGSRPESWWRS